MKNKNEEIQVIKNAIKFYHATVKEYAVLGSINDVLQSMIDDLVSYTCDPMPEDWQRLAVKLYNDLNIVAQAAQDNGVTNANVLSPLYSAAQVARNLTKLNNTEPVQKLQHYYTAIRNNLCDALRNVSPNPDITSSKSYKAVSYNALVRNDEFGIASILKQLVDVNNGNELHPSITPETMMEDIIAIEEQFLSYRDVNGRGYNNPKFYVLLGEVKGNLKRFNISNLNKIINDLNSAIVEYGKNPIR